MKHFRHLRFISLPILILWMASTMTGQQNISFKTGDYMLIPIKGGVRQSNSIQYLFYQADHVLSFEERNKLKKEGTEILYALHNHLYWVRVTKAQDEISSAKLFNINPAYKLGVDLSSRSSDNRYRLTIAPGMQRDELNAWAALNQIKVLDTRMYAYGFIDVEAQDGTSDILVNTPWVSFIGSIPHDEEVNYRAHHGERGWGLTSTLTRGLNGSGVTIGIGDGGRLNLHDDLKTSIIDLSSYAQSEHATQVSGIVTGAGLIDPFYGYGYAPKANVILRNFSDILWDAPQYINDFGLSLTNNSYGTSLDDCVYFGDYDGTSAGLDAMITAHPQLLHVFAAANSGGMTCSPYPVRYATLAGGYQPAKNVLTAGAVTNDDANAGFSSRGPADDGRLKPEVVAYGAGRFTTTNNHQYGSNSGTSFSSPATSGIATLLYQRYRQLHADSLPDAALIKNVICNAAEDLGNTGPDYTYGFGRINGVRAAEILESGHYTSVNVDQGNTITKAMTIPSGTGLVDVMLMWSDPASAPFETVTLVNDLELTVITPAGDTVKPWKLNYTPSGVANAAGTGADHINNYEQVTISTPVSGTYTLVVKGYQVPMGPQKAWLSWDVCLAGITVQGPIGGEVYKPGNPAAPNDKQYVRWDAFGTGASTFTAEYSTNGGTTWTTIASAIPANRRYQEWFPPNVPTDQLKARVTATNGMQDVSDQNAVIMAAPGSLTVPTPCRGYVQPSWSAVPGASYYRVFTIKDEILTAIDTTSGTSIVLDDFPPDTAVWVTVSGVFASGVNGLRARAVLVTANGGNNCSWSNDLRLDSLVALTSGRILTSTALTSTEPVTVRITNAGTTNASGFTMSYLLNSNPVFSQTFPGTINAGTGQDFTFTKLADLAATQAPTRSRYG
ncbi:MAG: S8 family serine peptidase [Saprospiraceae bacterium]|nr:S8 family serine peptidase [Candidatus Opimibacter iunctus]